MASALIGPVITLFLSAIVALLGSFVLPTEIEVKDMWEGKVAEESSRDLAPDCGYIADEQSLTELWSDWRKDEELPEVDFEQELVLVGTVPGPNRVIIEKKLSDDGDLKMKVAGTEIAGSGFGYQMLRVGRQGIESVNGEPIEFNGVRGIVDIPSVVPTG